MTAAVSTLSSATPLPSVTIGPTVDLFAGCGGHEVGMRMLDPDVDPLGIDVWGPANDTATAAGFRRLDADVAAIDPRTYPDLELLTASPPCFMWSTAGTGKARALTAPTLNALGDTVTFLRYVAGVERPRKPIEEVAAARVDYLIERIVDRITCRSTSPRTSAGKRPWCWSRCGGCCTPGPR